MANEGERSTTADKGKGKVDDVRELNGKKPQKDEKTSAEGKKKDGEPQEGMLCLHPCPEHVASESSPSVWIEWLTSVKKSLARRISN